MAGLFAAGLSGLEVAALLLEDAELVFDLALLACNLRALERDFDLGLAELLAPLVLELFQMFAFLLDDVVGVEHLAQRGGADHHRAKLVALMFEQLLEFIDLAVPFGQ